MAELTAQLTCRHRAVADRRSDRESIQAEPNTFVRRWKISFAMKGRRYCHPVSIPPLSRRGHSLAMFHLVSLAITALIGDHSDPFAIRRHRDRRLAPLASPRQYRSAVLNITGVADGRPRGLGMRLFVTVNTARISFSASLTVGTSTFCRVRGDDDELQLSDHFQRVYADYRLCGAAARRRRRRAYRKALPTAAPRSGQQMPKSPCELSELMSRTIAP